jgi:hypothetical protein
MRNRQAGITFIGWIVLLIPVAILAFAGIKLAPLYMTQFKVAKVLEQTADTTKGDTVLSPAAVRNELERRLDIESVDDPKIDDFTIERDGDNWVLIVEYNRETSLFGNVSLLAHFYKRVVLQ